MPEKHIHQVIIEYGFDTRSPMLLMLSIAELKKDEVNYGFPDPLLDEWRQRNAGMLPIQFDDPKYFKSMGVEFFDEEFQVSLSFDRLYRVRIPYFLIVQASLSTGVGEPPEVVVEEARPGLRLV